MATFLTATDAGYDAELAGFNTAFPQQPDFVVGAESEADVVEAVAFARSKDLPVFALATGHGTHHPLSTGLVINTSRIADVAIDPSARTATIGGGARWAAVIAAAAEHGLAPITGSSTNVGVVGYLLGGGLGPVIRSHGFSSDWVRGFRLVTADGEVLTVNGSENQDLFWALRGGKGGFGIVTEVTIELVPLTSLYAGSLAFDEPDIEAALRGWVDFTATAPDEVTTSTLIIGFPPFEFIPEPLRGRRLLFLRFAYAGDAATGAELAAPLRALAPVYIDALHELPAADVALIHNDPSDPGPGWGLGGLLNDLDQDFASALLGFVGSGSHSPFMAAEVRHLGGAGAVDVPEGSAVGGRDADYAFHLIGAPDPSLFETVLPAAGAGFLEAIARWRSPETTINFADSSDPASFRAAWSAAAFDRLAGIRESVDPSGVFAFGPGHA